MFLRATLVRGNKTGFGALMSGLGGRWAMVGVGADIALAGGMSRALLGAARAAASPSVAQDFSHSNFVF